MNDLCQFCTYKGVMDACESAGCYVHDSWYVKESEKHRMEATAGFIEIITELQNEIDRLKSPRHPDAQFRNVLLSDEHRVWQVLHILSTWPRSNGQPKVAWSVKMLATIAGTTQDRARYALESLIAKGLVDESDGRFRALPGVVVRPIDWHKPCKASKVERKDNDDPSDDKDTTTEG